MRIRCESLVQLFFCVCVCFASLFCFGPRAQPQRQLNSVTESEREEEEEEGEAGTGYPRPDSKSGVWAARVEALHQLCLEARPWDMDPKRATDCDAATLVRDAA